MGVFAYLIFELSFGHFTFMALFFFKKKGRHVKIIKSSLWSYLGATWFQSLMACSKENWPGKWSERKPFLALQKQLPFWATFTTGYTLATCFPLHPCHVLQLRTQTATYRTEARPSMPKLRPNCSLVVIWIGSLAFWPTFSFCLFVAFEAEIPNNPSERL